MSSWSMPSPETPIAPTNWLPRKIGTLPGKIWMPLAMRSASPVVPAQPFELSPSRAAAQDLVDDEVELQPDVEDAPVRRRHGKAVRSPRR